MPQRPPRSPRPGPVPPARGEDPSQGGAKAREDRSLPQELPPVDTARRRARFDRAVLDSLPFLVWLKDIDGRFVAVNRQFAEVTGHAGPAAHRREDGLRFLQPGTGGTLPGRRPGGHADPPGHDRRGAHQSRRPAESGSRPSRRRSRTRTARCSARSVSRATSTSASAPSGCSRCSAILGVALAEAAESGAAYAALLRHALDVPGVEGAGVYESREDGAFALRAHEGLSDEFASLVAVMRPDHPEVRELHRRAHDPQLAGLRPRAASRWCSAKACARPSRCPSCAPARCAGASTWRPARSIESTTTPSSPSRRCACTSGTCWIVSAPRRRCGRARRAGGSRWRARATACGTGTSRAAGCSTRGGGRRCSATRSTRLVTASRSGPRACTPTTGGRSSPSRAATSAASCRTSPPSTGCGARTGPTCGCSIAVVSSSGTRPGTRSA